ncbi:MAG: hypothetical protein KJZ92_13925 [Rhodocyclaceae bacterium]|nr:hypothetical protein [Rhodocyclaceae bacterium]
MYGAQAARAWFRRSLQQLPPASRGSAFLSGVSFAILLILLDAARQAGLLPGFTESRAIFLVILAFYGTTIVLFVIDHRLISAPQLKTRIPWVYFPTNRAGMQIILQRWSRYCCWFLGATCADLVRLGLVWALRP